MYLKNLSIIQYKNIQEAKISFSPRLNCFFGKNGEGKTNFLDAIYYLSFCKSHTNPIDTQNILHDAPFFVLQGLYVDDHSQEKEYYCGLKHRQKKVFKHDKKEYERLAEHIGQIPLVIISPSDEDLIKEGSDERRRFIDVAISQYDKEYMQALMRYNKALQQRNSLLKNDVMARNEDLYELYESILSECGHLLYQKRAAFIEVFTPVFEQYYQSISGGKESICLRYLSHLEKGRLDEQLKQSREKDRLLGFTTKGSHKDDIEMSMDGYPIKRIGSQGQNKTYLIAMKLAQFDYLKQTGGETPILLLDDIFDKLDASRVERIISLTTEPQFGQIFLTDTHREHLNPVLQTLGQDYRVFEIAQGGIQTAK